MVLKSHVPKLAGLMPSEPVMASAMAHWVAVPGGVVGLPKGTSWWAADMVVGFTWPRGLGLVCWLLIRKSLCSKGKASLQMLVKVGVEQEE